MTDKYKNIFHTLLIFLIVCLLLNSKILSNFVWTFPQLFVDFTGPINWLECHHLGYNLITLDLINCGSGNIGQFNYGYAFLSVPYNEFLGVFYRIYLPWLIIFLFIYFSVLIFNPKTKQSSFLLYLAILNPSTLLLIERMQLDSLFYLAIIFTIYNRYYIINWFVGIFFALIKFYPIAILITIFVEDKKRSLKLIFSIITFLSLIFLIYLLINKQSYLFMVNNMLPGKAGYHFLYSLNAFPKIFKYMLELNYQFLLLIFYSLFIFVTVIVYKKINIDNTYIQKSLYSNKSKLFLIAGYFNLFLFTLVSSYVYKEVYLLLFIPFILHIKDEYKNKIFNFLVYIIIARYLFLFIYAYINVHDDISFVEGQRIFSSKFLLAITIKATLDFVLNTILVAILVLKTRFYIIDKFKMN